MRIFYLLLIGFGLFGSALNSWSEHINFSMSYEIGHSEPIVLSWNTVPGQSYNLYSTASLASASWQLETPEPLVADSNQMTIRFSDSDSGYFRVDHLVAAIPVNRIGFSEQLWMASDNWDPLSLNCNVSGPKTLITLGCWWDGNKGDPTPLPSDSNGQFSYAYDRDIGLADVPVQVQVGYQTIASAGTHVITPPDVRRDGDGYLLVLEAEGLDVNTPVRDFGQSRDSHPIYGENDPNSIESITVSTEGSAAQVGDLAVAIIVMDPTSNPDINITLPEGWTNLGFNDYVVDNVGYRACYKTVTSPGTQNLTCSWTDGSTFVAEAAIVVFKAAE